MRWGRKSALHKASERGLESIVQLSVTNAADVKLFDDDLETPLHMASSFEH